MFNPNSFSVERMSYDGPQNQNTQHKSKVKSLNVNINSVLSLVDNKTKDQKVNTFYLKNQINED